jgi:hypothetical protein
MTHCLQNSFINNSFETVSSFGGLGPQADSFEMKSYVIDNVMHLLKYLDMDDELIDETVSKIELDHRLYQKIHQQLKRLHRDNVPCETKARSILAVIKLSYTNKAKYDRTPVVMKSERSYLPLSPASVTSRKSCERLSMDRRSMESTGSTRSLARLLLDKPKKRYIPTCTIM